MRKGPTSPFSHRQMFTQITYAYFISKLILGSSVVAWYIFSSFLIFGFEVMHRSCYERLSSNAYKVGVVPQGYMSTRCGQIRIEKKTTVAMGYSIHHKTITMAGALR